MSSNLGYEIVESATRGKIVIATRDFLPGDTVIEEKEPVLCLPKAEVEEFKKYDSTENSQYLAAFVIVMKRIDPAKKAKLLTLYGPTTGVSADNLRQYASGVHFSPNDDTDPRPMTPEEIEAFIKINNVVRLNAFGDEDEKLVYTEITRLAHSCDANCAYGIHNRVNSCRTVRNIKAGEELTISYMPARDSKPTHIRRQKYLETKEFTCHCPRCDALGDDTRQFDCCWCKKGVMMVCQPINKEEIRITNMPYDGVEYVEPHLLPCSVCHRAATAAYQTKMLTLEAQLPELVEDLVHRQADMVKRVELGADRYDRLVKEIYELKLPMRHQMVMPVHNVLVKSLRFLFMDVAMGLRRGNLHERQKAVFDAATAYIATQEGVTPGNNSNMANALFQVCFDCMVEWLDPRMARPPPFTAQQAKPLLQRLVRMKLIMSPRDAPRQEKIQAALLKTLGELAPLQSTALCAFCEESPLRAAVILSRCGRCKKVCYCSAGCQKVHWALHKKTCKVEKK